jgi:hypothetical protein
MSKDLSLYRHFDESGNLLYVGISLSFINRTSQHKYSSDWYKLIRQITIEKYDDEDELYTAETDAILKEKPKYNKRKTNNMNNSQICEASYIPIETGSYDDFYNSLLIKVQSNWNKSGNDLIGISIDKMYRLFSGKQKDFETLVLMAEFMDVSFWFKAF